MSISPLFEACSPGSTIWVTSTGSGASCVCSVVWVVVSPAGGFAASEPVSRKAKNHTAPPAIASTTSTATGISHGFFPPAAGLLPVNRSCASSGVGAGPMACGGTGGNVPMLVAALCVGGSVDHWAGGWIAGEVASSVGGDRRHGRSTVVRRLARVGDDLRHVRLRLTADDVHHLRDLGGSGASGAAVGWDGEGGVSTTGFGPVGGPMTGDGACADEAAARISSRRLRYSLAESSPPASALSSCLNSSCHVIRRPFCGVPSAIFPLAIPPDDGCLHEAVQEVSKDHRGNYRDEEGQCRTRGCRE